MRALTLHQPYAALVAHGHKRIETRPAPPAGDMCPPGVRPYPGARLNRGDVLLIHAGQSKAGPPGHPMWDPFRTAPGSARLDPPLRFGVIYAITRIVDAVPIVDEDHAGLDGRCVVVRPERRYTRVTLYRSGRDIAGDASYDDEYDRGDFTPGRWAWILQDVDRVPVLDDLAIKATGRQGVWLAPYDVYRQVAPLVTYPDSAPTS